MLLKTFKAKDIKLDENKKQTAVSTSFKDNGYFIQLNLENRKSSVLLKIGLKDGEYTDEPVKSEYGYHIIKVFDKIDEQQPLSEVKDTIKTTLLNEKYAQTVEKLKKSAKIEKNEEVIKKIKLYMEQLLLLLKF